METWARVAPIAALLSEAEKAQNTGERLKRSSDKAIALLTINRYTVSVIDTGESL